MNTVKYLRVISCKHVAVKRTEINESHRKVTQVTREAYENLLKYQ